jgi:hypothetical protein
LEPLTLDARVPTQKPRSGSANCTPIARPLWLSMNH